MPGGARRAERPAVQGGGELAQVRPSPRQLLPTVTLQEDAVLDPAPLDPAPCTRRPLRKPISAGLGPLGPLGPPRSGWRRPLGPAVPPVLRRRGAGWLALSVASGAPGPGAPFPGQRGPCVTRSEPSPETRSDPLGPAVQPGPAPTSQVACPAHTPASLPGPQHPGLGREGGREPQAAFLGRPVLSLLIQFLTGSWHPE